MVLKKNDQLIIIAAVVVIIIAGAGVALYAPPETTDIVEEVEDSDTYTYEISSEVKEGELSEMSEQFAKKLFSKWGTAEIVFHIGNIDNLKDVEIEIAYKDNFKLWIFLNDKASFEITDPSGTVSETIEIKGEGNETVTYSAINSEISNLDPIEAESLAEAQSILEERYKQNWKDGEFTVNAGLKLSHYLGFRLLEKLTKDSFTVNVKYTYYDYEVTQVMEEDDDMTETGSNVGGDAEEEIPYMSMIIGTGCGRFV